MYQNAGRVHRHFASKDGDFITLINIYDAWIKVQYNSLRNLLSDGSIIKAGKSKMWSSRSYLNHRALVHAESIRMQISSILREQGIDIDPSVSCGSERDPILKCISKGLSANIAASTSSIDVLSGGKKGGPRKPGNTYSIPTSQAPYRTLSGGQDVHIHPSSAMFMRGASALPKYVVYAEILVTTKHYMRYVSVLDADWIPELNLSHVKLAGDSQGGALK